ncbi:putative ABC transport system permease protein [Ruminiclostridium sufflavum DSM 19573]|uniref:Putative hemin transport system permease protein HrtB n=1 Tax=Ruminiclostridium sufflavum DSM 19573 TaxID=1121337 RepID=A0A318XNY0_9FIRM|nr:FtsX-like permease family protein [Ruminiclostridium sufflavum]PYG88536.1 putative ABC transport system permease protein [Ruminiclostridium sufflavum DSM 19573]
MSDKPLSITRLSLYNLRGKAFRTGALIAVVLVLAFALFSGAVLSASLQNGLNSLKERLGADIAVVPLGYENSYQGIILSGEPVRFYFDRALEQQISKVDGVEQLTSQFYLSTLSADCCSVPVQIIGIDPETDFVTKPWISEVYREELKDRQAIVGADIAAGKDNKLTFYNHEFSVAARLEKTSTGMDNSVFVNIRAVKALAESAKKQGLGTNASVQEADLENSISSVLIKTERGYDTDQVVTNIRREVDGISMVKSKSIFSGFSENLGIIKAFIGIYSAALWILALLILAILFSAIISSRKKEFSVLRIMGTTRVKLVRAVLTEAMLVSIVGSLAGVSLAAVVIFPFSAYIGEQLGLPFLLPDIGGIFVYMISTLVLSSASGPLSAIYAAVKISRAETYITLREGE